MPLRSALLVLLLAGLLPSASAQVCFMVAQQEDVAPLAGCTALNTWRTVLGTSDARGLLCVGQPVDTVLLECLGRAPRRIALNDAVQAGLVLLAPAPRELVPLTIEPWPTPRDRQALASTSAPDSALLHGFERSSLRSAAVWSPGVQWDQRGLGGSSRLGIRGSLLRSPFGVRGVKVYWGPFPLTLADGSTPLELLDPALVDELDVVRSVGSPVFGSAPSGLVLARPHLPEVPSRELGAEVLGGSDGYYRLAVQAATATPTGSLAVGLVKQGNDGYREQEWSQREQAWLVSRWRGKGTVTQAYVTVQRAAWALPGSLDSLTAYTSPRNARPYSALVNAQVDKSQLLAGVFNELRIARTVQLRTGIHGQAINKENPYGTSPANNGYKDERIGAAGARLALAGDHRKTGFDLAWEAGLEALAQRDDLVERTYVDGVQGDLRTDAETRVGCLNPFAALHLRSDRVLVHAAIGGERYLVRHDDRLRDTLQRQERDASGLPMVGVSYDLTPLLLLHGRYAQSTSRPTVWELLGSTGVLNPDLGPEQVREWEAGLGYGNDTAAVRCNASAYARRTDGLIQAVPINGTDQVTYRNVGSARQNGIELAITGEGRMAGGAKLALQAFGALQDHRLFPADGGPSQQIPGVPPLTFGLLARASLRKGTAFEAGWRGVDAVTANTAGTAEVPGYDLLHARVAHRFTLKGAGGLSLFIHVDNLLDQRYTGFVQLNDPTGRYYNPAPGRSFFAGCSYAWSARERSP